MSGYEARRRVRQVLASIIDVRRYRTVAGRQDHGSAKVMREMNTMCLHFVYVHHCPLIIDKEGESEGESLKRGHSA